MTSPLCVATGGWCRRVFHYRPPTPMYRNSPPLCTIVLQIPSLMPLKMRKVQLEAQELFQAQLRVQSPKCGFWVLRRNPETPVESRQELLQHAVGFPDAARP